ncbi:AraC family transcriptional regulator [Rhizobium sophorae]|uniref:AraC family transcriptional regulator n=1 Tax=Rhizobium sophorae TaxID=1535242 RepID=A0A7Y3WCU2_9HYPH|nr:AraC family transcriptional regulator [Rhizobium sophorae]MBX4862801.1 AraC family transcriptional regulator [Rhizobium bangladeshense]NNU35171.1 AraC family transcriptional regulator [Rhizobium sophorae]
MDPLSDILTMFTVQRVATIRFESSGPYALRFGGYDHIKFGAILSGSLRLWVEGNPIPIELGPGDCYLLTDGRPYRTSNSEDAQEIDGNVYFAGARGEDGTIKLGEGPIDKVAIGGRFVFDEEGAAWLRSALPTIIHIKASSPAAGPLRRTLELLGLEAGGGAPGENVIVDRLADILLVQALRAYLAESGPGQASWLAGLADPKLARAMRSFHNDVAADWSVASMASVAGMSRSSFAEKFKSVVGVTPLDYVTRWRMQRVRRALIETDLAFATIAEDNGYRSRTSCSQTFKRVFGHPPQDLRTYTDPHFGDRYEDGSIRAA